MRERETSLVKSWWQTPKRVEEWRRQKDHTNENINRVQPENHSDLLVLDTHQPFSEKKKIDEWLIQGEMVLPDSDWPSPYVICEQ